jgi:type IV pilus assembly protein PilB
MADNEQVAILQQLAGQGAITPEQQQAIFQQLTGTEGELKRLLVDSKVLSEDVLAQAHATVMGLPYIDLRGKTIPKEVLNIIPESTARGHLVVTYEATADLVRVAMANPKDRQMVEFIHKKVDRPVEVSLSSETALREILNQYHESLDVELKDVIQNIGPLVTTDDPTKAAEDAPIVRITDAILKHAIVQRASDIHMEPLEDRVIIRYRVDGILYDKLVLPKTMVAGLVARIKVLSNLKIDEHRLPQDGRFKLATDEYQVSFRVSILPVFDGEKVVMRLLDESGQSLSLGEIGMRPSVLDIFRRNISKPHGMILVTGPTGSGKTTTLYAAMKELNTPEVNISTVEDPIEYRMPRVNQTQVKPQIGLTFANGLRSLVRQDPDIIMVGEIRDTETASLAINAALTGHLVLSTLHTNSAAGALPRLLDMKVEAFLVASTVNILVAQRLVRRLCTHCRKPSKMTKPILESIQDRFQMERVLELIGKETEAKGIQNWESVPLWEPVGCNRCSGGYKGRLGVYEVLEVTPTIQKIITPQTTSQDLENAAKQEQGMITMLEDGLLKAVEGTTTIEEVLRVAKE